MQRPLKMNKANLNGFAELMNLHSMYYKLFVVIHIIINISFEHTTRYLY